MKVIFRIYNDGQVIALFPELTNRRNYCVESYMHIGQHSDADYSGVIQSTRLAKESEYKPLMSELEAIGYDDLKVCKKAKVSFY